MSEVFEKKSVSSELAHRVIAAAEAKASEMGVPMGIAVCDEAGVLKAFSRMDGAALFAVQIAQDKAYTAVGFGMPSGGWHDFIKDDPPLAAGAVGGIDRLVIFGGGFPITSWRDDRRRDRRQRWPLQPGHGGRRGRAGCRRQRMTPFQ